MTTGKTIKQRFMAILFSLVLTIAGAGIAVQTAQPVNVEAATTVKLSKTKATLIKGQSLQLKMTGMTSKVTWNSSNRKVATVNSAGKVIAVNKGTATITAKVGSKPYTCRLTVETPKLSKTAISLNEKKTYTLKVSGTTQKITWKSSNTSIATVSSAGKVTAKKAGTATITATILNKKYNCKVTVKKAPAVSNVPSCVASQTMYVLDHGYIDIPDCFIYIKNLAANAKVTNVKSSNSKLEASKRTDIDAIEVRIPQKIGTPPPDVLGVSSTITFNVTQNGKNYRLSCKINIKKKPSPFASFKIGSKDIAKSFDGCMDAGESGITGKQKISIKMASGYVLDSIDAFIPGTMDSKDIHVKNGSSINITENMHITICYHTTKKPANYKASDKWYGVVPSALHNMRYLDFF